MAEKKGVQYFPITLFASVMGIAGVAIALQLIETLYGLTNIISTLFIGLATVMFVLNGLILLYRLIKHPAEVERDFNHPVKMNFFGAISISLLLLAVLYADFHEGFSYILWVSGAFFQLILTIVLLARIMWEKEYTFAQFNPTWIIPIVGNIVVPLAGVLHTSAFINWLFFSMGFVFTIIYLVLLVQRLFFHGSLPEELTPTLFIMLAPLGIGFVSYTNLVGQLDALAYILYGLGFYLGLLLLYQIKRFVTIPFTLSWWAYLFPSAAMTNATYGVYIATNETVLKVVFIIQVIGLLLLSIYLLTKTIQSALHRQL